LHNKSVCQNCDWALILIVVALNKIFPKIPTLCIKWVNYLCFFSLTIRFILFLLLISAKTASAATIEFNSTGGTSATNGLHIYIDDSTQIQVRRLNNTGQVYAPTALPPSTNLDNGIFLRANGLVYGPDHNVATFAPSGGMYSTRTITATTPPNPSAFGDQQTATHNFGITLGPQVTVVWKYTTALDFLTAEVTLVIPPTYAVSASNPVRYYHVFDTYLGGSDNGCGFQLTDSNGKRVVGTYPPASGTTCPSSSSIPTGVSVVESFRERSGLTFSNYCASGWNSFWINGSTNCSILQSANMSNTIATTFQDTGIGIQYNFTAAGTYSFSYDFVVGSPLVPPYDHLEIRHPGTTTLCPANITVLACTSSIVPCPAANIVNTGTLTGSIRQTPAAPSITQTPANFTIGSSASTANIVFQGSGAGTFTLTGQGLSSTPLNGTKCWNTSSSIASCSFSVTSASCVSGYECLETGLTYNNLNSSPSSRNPLYTKVSGNGFKFDIVALQSSGAQSTTYTASSGVTVQLFDDSVSPQPACSAYNSPIASQAITFVAGDSGRKTLPIDFNINNAYRKLRCRVVDSNLSPIVYGCSSDSFSIRPSNYTISSSANADNTGTNSTSTLTVKAGNNFTLTAATGLTGYNGIPKIDNTKISAHSGAIQAGSLSGSFNAANAGTASSLAFSYSEVGYFRFSANGIYDDTFTAIDSALGDCATGFSASGNRNACNFGNTATTNFFGRFIPNHFDTVTTQGCSTGGFTYASQPFNTEVTARNFAGLITKNYDGSSSFSKTVTLSDANAVSVGSLIPATLTASAFIAGAANALPAYTLTNPKTAPTTIKLRATDLDNVQSSTTEGIANIRSGRIYLTNAYGSELLPLTVPIEAQYWNGTSYIKNQQDNCTAIPASSIAMGNYRNNLAACETQISGTSIMSTGKTTFTLSKPGVGNSGSVDLSINLNSASGLTCNSATQSSASAASIPWFGSTNPSARETFGLFKTPIIYMRENF
jgi:MSHA biogenesis protein MshQ